MIMAFVGDPGYGPAPGIEAEIPAWFAAPARAVESRAPVHAESRDREVRSSRPVFMNK